MTGIIVALDEPRASDLAQDLAAEGVAPVLLLASDAIDAQALVGVDTVLVPATRTAITPELLRRCDVAGVRIVPIGGADSRLLARYGLPKSLPVEAEAWQILEALRHDTPAPAVPRPPAHRVIAVWGPHGAPGRTTIAIELAAELARDTRSVALLDADSHAPAVAVLLGLSDESPGLAAACRRAGLGGLDATELARIAAPLPTSAGTVEVLSGLNRPSRWPELSASRLHATLTACRDWVDDTIVDVAAPIEQDEEIVSDFDGPRRNAATTTVLRAADVIIAVASAEPLGIARFLRDYPEVRTLAADAQIIVVVNRLRPGPLGIDARGQIRSALERFAGIREVLFLPQDSRAADAALLHATTLADVSPRSSFVTGVRTLASMLRPTARDGRKRPVRRRRASA